jgi:succinoglycan biosynthesis transport protein ExoP
MADAAPSRQAKGAASDVNPALARLASAQSQRPAEPAAPVPAAPNGGLKALSSIDEVARRILDHGQTQGGFRTVISGEAPGVDVAQEATAIADALTASGKQVVLVDWNLSGNGIAQDLGLEAAPGFTDLLEGRASFEEVIRRLPDGDTHVVPCGSAHQDGAEELNADRLNLVLDALDEAYDHIVVTGDHQAIRDLFLAVEGRFDAGIVVADRRSRTATSSIAPGLFLGFQVTDIELMRLDRGTPAGTQKMQLARAPGGTEAHA